MHDGRSFFTKALTMNIKETLQKSAKEALKTTYGVEVTDEQIQIQQTRKEFEGDLTLIIFPLVKVAKKKPEECANELGEAICGIEPLFTKFNVVKGFLNLCVADYYWINFFNEASRTKSFGFSEPKSKSQAMVEYSSPNTNKPLHLGHLRNNFLGFSVSRILEAYGHDVLKVQIINDRGIHICKSMLAWDKFANGETPESTGMKGDKLVGKYYVAFDKAYKAEIKALMSEGKSKEEAEKNAPILLEAKEMLRKWENKDPLVTELWKTMNSWVYDGFESTYAEMGVSFDKLYFESNTYLKGKKEVEKGLEKGVFFKKEDGSVWCDLTDDGLDQKLVLRGDGTSVYMTQDIGTAILRFQNYPNLDFQVYTVGNEQEYHFKVLFLILKKLGFDKSGMNHHLSYGMVELPEGKMKSREGTVVDADELLIEMRETAREISQEQGKLQDLTNEEKESAYRIIGYGAIKYFLLKVDPRKGMKFDPKESIDFLGNTGPFIQFNYVRTQGILRKYGRKIEAIDTTLSLDVHEKNLIQRLHDFTEQIANAAANYDPSQIASFVYDLAKDFSSFYQQCHILKEEDSVRKNFRIQLCETAGATIKNALWLLGIDVPERM